MQENTQNRELSAVDAPAMTAPVASAVSAPVAPAGDGAATFALLQPDNFQTGGEKAFNAVTYRGVDWLLNSAFGVAFSYWTARTRLGQKVFSNGVTNACREILRPIIKDPKELEVGAAWGRNFASIIIGGFAIIPIMVGLEKNKKPIVQSLDRAIYGNDRVNNDPAFAAAYEEIGKEKKQSVGISMGARILSLIPLLYAATRYPEAMGKFYAPFSSASRWFADLLHIKPKGLIARTMADENGKLVNDLDYIHNNIGFDFSLTFLYSFLHEWSTKLLTNIFGKAGEPASPARPKTHEPLIAENNKEPEPEAKPSFLHSAPQTHVFAEKIHHEPHAIKGVEHEAAMTLGA